MSRTVPPIDSEMSAARALARKYVSGFEPNKPNSYADLCNWLGSSSALRDLVKRSTEVTSGLQGASQLAQALQALAEENGARTSSAVRIAVTNLRLVISKLPPPSAPRPSGGVQSSMGNRPLATRPSSAPPKAPPSPPKPDAVVLSRSPSGSRDLFFPRRRERRASKGASWWRCWPRRKRPGGRTPSPYGTRSANAPLPSAT